MRGQLFPDTLLGRSKGRVAIQELLEGRDHMKHVLSQHEAAKRLVKRNYRPGEKSLWEFVELHCLTTQEYDWCVQLHSCYCDMIYSVEKHGRVPIKYKSIHVTPWDEDDLPLPVDTTHKEITYRRFSSKRYCGPKGARDISWCLHALGY